MKKIMVATDFSERSDRALRRAILLAKQTGASLRLVNVVDHDRPRRIVDLDRQNAEQLLSESVSTIQNVDGVKCEAFVVAADPFSGLIQSVEAAKPDLLIIGPHRRQILMDAFIGTMAERVIRSVSCPVLMANAPPVAPYRHVLQTTDLSEVSRHALQHAADLALAESASESILHIFDAPVLRLGMSGSISKEDLDFHLQEEAGSAKQALVNFTGQMRDSTATHVVRHGYAIAAYEILKAASELGADLIVQAAHGRSTLSRLLLGSVTERILQLSPIDVLVIPAGPH